MKRFFSNIKIAFKDLDSFVFSDRYISKKAKIALLVFILILSVVFVVNYVYIKSRENSYSNITELVNNKEYEAAYYKLESLLKKNPADPYYLILSARVALGVSEKASNNEMRKFYLSKSLDFLKQAEMANPDLIEIYRTRGLTYLHLGELSLSEHAYQKMLTLNKESSQGWTDLGNVYLIQGNITSAGDSFAKALTLDPKNEQALIGDIRILILQNRTDRVINLALPLYRKTLDTKIKLQLAEILGNAYSKLTKYTEAEKYFNEGLALDPQSVSINYGLAELSFYSNFNVKNPTEGSREAIELANNVIKLDPSYPYSYALLTRIAEATDNRADYDKYLALTKDKMKSYPFMSVTQKEVFLQTLPLFNKSSGNVTIKVLSVKSSAGGTQGDTNILKSK